RRHPQRRPRHYRAQERRCQVRPLLAAAARSAGRRRAVRPLRRGGRRHGCRRMSTATRHRLIGFAVAGLIFVADQCLKWLVNGPLAMRLGDSIELLPFFNFTRTHNYGVSLGMFSATSPEMRWALVALTCAIAIAVTVWMLRERKLGDIVALALVLGGALGNILDRVR